MPGKLFIGGADPLEIRVGNAKAKEIYLGSNKIWSYLPDNCCFKFNGTGKTTSSISQSGGVTEDINGYNGRAYNGVQIVNDNDLGDCFSFDGTDDYIEFNNANIASMFRNIPGVTLCFKFKPVNVSGSELVIFEGFYNSTDTTVFAGRIKAGNLVYYARRNSADTWTTYTSSFALSQNSLYKIVISMDFLNGKIRLYNNGVLDAENAIAGTNGNLINGPTFFWSGKHSKPNRFFKGLLTDVELYSYAFTDNQAKRYNLGL